MGMFSLLHPRISQRRMEERRRRPSAGATRTACAAPATWPPARRARALAIRSELDRSTAVRTVVKEGRSPVEREGVAVPRHGGLDGAEPARRLRPRRSVHGPRPRFLRVLTRSRLRISPGIKAVPQPVLKACHLAPGQVEQERLVIEANELD